MSRSAALDIVRRLHDEGRLTAETWDWLSPVERRAVLSVCCRAVNNMMRHYGRAPKPSAPTSEARRNA